MPESVTDRCTKAHEYIFLLSKSPKYYYDADAIREDIKMEVGETVRFRERKTDKPFGDRNVDTQQGEVTYDEIKGANKRSVWTVTTKPFSEAHFATFPEDLIVDCIKAGCPRDGIVLDPFMGAGTTALVARSHNRNYIGFELNPEYIAIAEKRLNKELGIFR
jgi:DNA modification methylase